MSIGIIKNESSIFLMEEVTEGTYVAPSSASEAVEVQAEGLALDKTRELLERNTLNSTTEVEAARVGIADVTGTIPVELKSNLTEGDAPQSLDVLLKSLLGGKRQITSDQTSASSHTSTRINFADSSAFSVADIVLIKEAGAFECRPISAISTDTYIEFPFALDNGAPSDSVVVAKTTTYFHDTTSSVTFSAEHNLGNQAIKQKAAGLRAASGNIENWTVGNLPTMSFAVQGLSLDREDADASFTPSFGDALPPVLLSACAWVGGEKMSYTELGLSIENTVNYISDACSASGKIGSRITSQMVNVNINPYMDDSDLTKTWDKFNNNTDTSVFAYAFNPSGVDGEFQEVTAFWIPQGKIVESPVTDNEGIISENLVIKSHRNSGNDTIFLSFI